jgi:hypothetical protein
MTFRQKSSYWIVQLWPLLNTDQEIVSIIFSCNNIISATFWVMSGSCQGLFNRPVSDEPTKSRGIKTEQILSSFLWLVTKIQIHFFHLWQSNFRQDIRTDKLTNQRKELKICSVLIPLDLVGSSETGRLNKPWHDPDMTQKVADIGMFLLKFYCLFLMCNWFLEVNLILYLLNEDCWHPMAMSGLPQESLICNNFKWYLYSWFHFRDFYKRFGNNNWYLLLLH